MEADGFDVIGDIHGHAGALVRLLLAMGYRETAGVFEHGRRRAIFAGDFIDRGPEQREALRIGRSMCEAGTAYAVMGNHEFNAIGWTEPDGKGGYLRVHSARNTSQHAEFLRQVVEGSPEHLHAIEWFRSLPLWLELEGLRVVHACWHAPSIAVLRPHLDTSNVFTSEGLRAAFMRGSEPYAAAEVLLKGPEQRLPEGLDFQDKDGHQRREVRTRWWDPTATTYRSAALGLEDRPHDLPDLPIPSDFKYSDKVPVCFGHYWMRGEPQLTSATAACLDFSVARQGYLAAYRWSGESVLAADRMVYVPAEPSAVASVG